MNKKNLKNLELIKKINKDFLINQKSDIFICLILLLLVSLTTAIYPFLIQKVFDNFTENKYSLFFLPTIIALVASIRGIAMFFQIKQVSKVTLKVSIDIQKKLSNHLLFSDLDMIKKISSGNHISRIMNDVNLIRDSVERSLNNLIRDLITIIFLIVYLIWLDWVLAVVVLSIYPLALKPIISIGKKQRFYALSLQEKMESLTSFLSEIFRNISMIKSYSLEKLEKNRINKSLDRNINFNSKKIIIKVDPYFFRPNDVQSLLGDSSKLFKLLKVKPKTSFKKLVKIMVKNEINLIKANKIY